MEGRSGQPRLSEAFRILHWGDERQEARMMEPGFRDRHFIEQDSGANAGGRWQLIENPHTPAGTQLGAAHFSRWTA